MRKDLSHWLQRPSISLKLVFLTCFIWIAGVLAFEFSSLSFEAETRLVNPLLFRVREVLGRSPKLHPNIKTYAIDDATVASMQRPHLQLEQWVELLELFDSRRPQAIVIDALFSVTDSALDTTEQKRQQLLNRLVALKTPVVVGSYATPRAIRGREAWDQSEAAFQLARYLKVLPNSPQVPDHEMASLPLAKFVNAFIYGPQSFLRPGLSRVGHIHYGQREGYFYPFLRLTPGQAVPHLMLRAVDKMSFIQGVLMVNGAELPMNRDGAALVNFNSYDTLRKHMRPLRLLLNKSSSLKELATINLEDFIYIVPMYYTGNTDFKPSPIGLLSGAFAHLAVLNSILLKSWLRPMESAPWLIVGFAGLAALLGWWLNPGTAIGALVMSFLGWTLACFGSFVGPGWMLPWLTPSFSFIGVGLSIVGLRIRDAERKAIYIRQSFEGAVQPAALKILAEHPEKLTLEARERVLTIMFIDIVGFSLTIENQLPRVTFDSLRHLIEDLSRVIHKHGGVVNKTLGDGLLCFFGYSFEEDRETSEHADQALKAAIEIQISNVERLVKAAHQGEPVFPLRIGINTAAVFMGNLGVGNRLDLNVIGNGVNFSKRLEGACQTHSVLVGPTTKELIEPFGAQANGKKRHISIKHHGDKVEAWEYDPFVEQPELREKAEAAYRLAAKHLRLECQWTVNEPEKIILMTSSGPTHLLNFSDSGLSFPMQEQLALGSHLTLRMGSHDGILQERLTHYGLQELRVEVRRLQKSEERYLYLAHYLELNAQQIEIITDLLCQFLEVEFVALAS